MALHNFGSLVLNLIIFITTLVNFSYALATLEPFFLLVLYAISKLYVRAPEEGIWAKCQLGYLYDPTMRPNNASHTNWMAGAYGPP